MRGFLFYRGQNLPTFFFAFWMPLDGAVFGRKQKAFSAPPRRSGIVHPTICMGRERILLKNAFEVSANLRGPRRCQVTALSDGISNPPISNEAQA